MRSVVVRHADGLHVRPAELVAKAAMRFDSDVSLVSGSLRVDAKSILNVITLGAHEGTPLVVEATGDDAEAAVAALAELIESDFSAEAVQVSVGAAGKPTDDKNNPPE
ncbi:MAG: HPr family phosphocarrier protein [Planctomycetota bacterium]